MGAERNGGVPFDDIAFDRAYVCSCVPAASIVQYALASGAWNADGAAYEG